MKKMNFKKIATMGLAAMMAMSAMSISAFAEEDMLITTMYDINNTPVEIYLSDIEKAPVTVSTDNGIVTIGIPDDNEKSTRLIERSSGSFRTSMPGTTKTVSGNNTYEHDYSISMGSTLYSPYKYIASSGYSSVKYTFEPDTDDKSYQILLTVYRNSIAQDEVAIPYTGLYYSLSGMTAGTTYTYAKIRNVGYSAGADGICTITN